MKYKLCTLGELVKIKYGKNQKKFSLKMGQFQSMEQAALWDMLLMHYMISLRY